MAEGSKFSLNDKYTQQEGTILLSGVQALARLPLDQRRADQRAGLNTAGFISGYRGSPLAGYDMALEGIADLLREHQITFMPGVNEDLAATAVQGSQIANLYPNPKYDGVFGIWYGKAPGVDRSGDVFKHANFTGVGRSGGVLALAGDDPVSKSSTLPSASETALFDAHMPILFPGSVGEILELGRFGFELSRYSGLWVGFKIVTDIADGFGSASVHPIHDFARPDFQYNGKPWQHVQVTNLVAPFSLQVERELVEGRLEAARRFAAANLINRIVTHTADDRIGIIAAGKTYYDLREALSSVGLNDEALNDYGIRILKVGMLYPLEPHAIKAFARGLDTLLVIEEKRAFIELFVRDILYNLPDRPLVIGKRDEQEQPLVRADGELDADEVTRVLAKALAGRVPEGVFAERMATLKAADLSLAVPVIGSQMITRTPYFCSGCPHNRSTVVPEGSIAGGGIGCHGMVLSMDRDTQGITHMGGEGVQWVGAAPFTNTAHLYQNLGDGTLFHSASLAIRQAIAAGTNITYKILYNGGVAMTGAQPADGAMAVPELTRALYAEGAKHIIVCADDPGKYPADTQWASGTMVWHRDRLEEAQIALRERTGVTILIYDQPCAADLRRQRKRGEVPDPPEQIFINEAVCEGCGDCGVKSNCLSVVPVDTEFGRKTQIHQGSCNKDYTCLQGDCPSFLSVIPSQQEKAPRRLNITIDADELPEPVRIVGEDVNLYMVGVGGTGVVTINQILGTAAHLEGKTVHNLDQTGLSQKGGPVLSHVKIGGAERSNKITAASADAYLVFDLLEGGKEKNLRHASPKKTVAVVSMSAMATGEMVRSTSVNFPRQQFLKRSIEDRTRRDHNLYLDANTLSENIFGSHMQANMIVVGAAYQLGLIPLRAETIEDVIRLNGVSVKTNLLAFRIGRKAAADPSWQPLSALKRDGDLEIAPELSAEARQIIDSVGAEGELRRLLEIRVPELIAYQNAAYARQYTAFIARVREKESAVTDETRFSEAVARYLFKLMAYKDEYEVARLHMRPEFKRELEAQFGAGAKIAYKLHPPLLRALGMKNKLTLGRWFDSGYRLLIAMKGLRGTPLDIFGYAQVRRVERQLIREYRALIDSEIGTLSADTYERAVKLAGLPDVIRGYEDIKLANVEQFRQQVEQVKNGMPAHAVP
ncbi:MAG: indolepyruvate ferredoxin oxidoreductase family protein [bacterium]|nr:indolepyruvate ferredoxin oxidoreductase family protein [bacterium]